MVKSLPTKKPVGQGGQIQLINAGIEIDPRTIRNLVFATDKVDITGSTVTANAGTNLNTSLLATEASSGKIRDENGVLQNWKINAGAPQVCAQPYLQAMAEGDIPQHSRFRQLGYSSVIGSSLVDLWDSSPAAVYAFPPTTGIQMQIKAGGNAADAGSVNFSGTSTGGSTTTLIDTGKNFTAGGTPVVAGDVILISVGNRIERGIVTAVAATTLTCADGFTGGASGSGRVYSVIDKSAGGAGIQVVKISYLDTLWQQKETFIVLNGVNAVDGTPTDIIRIQHFETLVAGANFQSSGIINLVDKATGTVIYSIIPAGLNSSQTSIWTVPAIDFDGNMLSAAYIIHWHVSALKTAGTPATTFRLRATCNEDSYIPNIFYLKDIVSVLNQSEVIHFESPIRIPSKSDIKISVQSDTASVICTGRFSGWYE